MNSSSAKAGWSIRGAALVRKHPALVIFAVAILTSLPCLWGLLQDLDDDPDMCRQADAIAVYHGCDVLRFFAETAPWGDGSYRPCVLLSWKLDSVLFGRWAPGWAFHNWLLAVLAVGTMGILTWWSTQRLEAGVIAAALAGLRQATALQLPEPWLNPLGLILPAGLALTLWTRRRSDGERFATWLWLGLLTLAVAVTVLHTEMIEQLWVRWYVGARTAALGTALHFLIALAAWKYLSGGRAAWLAGALTLWAVTLLSYEQPLCLPLAAALVFALGLRGVERRRLYWLLGGMTLLIAAYAGLRLHFLAEQGITGYQALQLRSGPLTLRDVAKYLFPPLRLAVIAHSLTPGWQAVFWPSLWLGVAVVCTWLLAYVPLARRQPQIAGWYWWRVAAYLPLLKFHPHPHYHYLPLLAVAATHGVIITALADAWRELGRITAGGGQSAMGKRQYDQRQRDALRG